MRRVTLLRREARHPSPGPTAPQVRPAEGFYPLSFRGFPFVTLQINAPRGGFSLCGSLCAHCRGRRPFRRLCCLACPPVKRFAVKKKGAGAGWRPTEGMDKRPITPFFCNTVRLALSRRIPSCVVHCSELSHLPTSSSTSPMIKFCPMPGHAQSATNVKNRSTSF